MKTIKLNFLTLFILIFGWSSAQISETISNPNSYWQLSVKSGYDFPMHKHDFKYIDYKGGIMGGLSLNRVCC